MTHEEKVSRWIGADALGTEIGAGSAPIPGFDPPPIYVDCFKAFGNVPSIADYYGHACALPFHDHTLDYVIASHVLEHVANPITALAEWYRVVKPGGIIYLVVPDRRFTWDRHRALTPVEHFFADYHAGTTAVDATHIDEFVNDVDWLEWSPSTSTDELPAKKAEVAAGLHASVARGEDINLHFHTFEPTNLRALLDALTRHRSNSASVPPLNASDPATTASTSTATPIDADSLSPRFHWEIVDFAERFPTSSPNGILAVLRVHKGWRARADAEVFRLRTNGERAAVLRPDAQPFADWAARTPGLGGVQ